MDWCLNICLRGYSASDRASLSRLRRESQVYVLRTYAPCCTVWLRTVYRGSLRLGDTGQQDKHEDLHLLLSLAGDGAP